ncbi:MAG TPA: hypothetical protein VKO45_09185 [Methanomicrobiales archaeon]|nr:hypothetical protein [Methanomicrobiales archaeon]
MAACEIHLNRRAINSIEIPAQADVEAGKSLILSFNNHGHPLHVSLSAINAARYTPFTHENLFIQGETDFEIPILEDAGEGAFSLEVVTGYGRTSCEMRVFVRRPQPEAPAEKPAEAPARRKIPWLRVGPVLLGLILYGASFLPDLGVLKDLAFFVLLAALLLAWPRKQG